MFAVTAAVLLSVVLEKKEGCGVVVVGGGGSIGAKFRKVSRGRGKESRKKKK